MNKSKEITLNVPLTLDFGLLRCQLDALKRVKSRLMPHSPQAIYMEGVVELFVNIQQYAVEKGVPRALVYGEPEATE